MLQQIIYVPSFLKAVSPTLPDLHEDDIPAIFPSLNYHQLSPPNGLFIVAREQAAISSTLEIYCKHTFLLNYSLFICFPSHQKYFDMLILDAVSISSFSFVLRAQKIRDSPIFPVKYFYK